MIEAEVKYKKTGIEWMPKVPEHWEIVRLKWVLRNGEGIKIGPFGSSLKLQDLDDNGIRVYGQENVIKDDFTLGKRFLSKEKFAELSVYEVFPKDILVTMMGTTGKCKLVPEDAEKGIMDSHLIRLRANGKMRPEFLSILINDSLQLKFQMSIDSKGSIMSGLNSKIVKNLFLPLPPVEEQNKIIDILNTESTKITRFIQTKQRFIELLKEQRQSIITNAVTKGIDDGVKMKETGIDWMGKVPEHWKVSRLKFVGESFIGLTYSPTEIVDKEMGILVLRSSNIQDGRLSLLDNVYVRKEVSEKLKTKKGDILLCSRNGSAELIGKNILIDDESQGNTFGAFMTIFRSPINHFLYYFFNSNIFLSQTSLFGTSTINQLTNDILKNLVVAYPEQLSEQMKIIMFIKSETKTLDIAISKAEREIELIKEYREAMIAEAVMGKMKL